eukprot:jgi/Botrbrau1/22933/Bobra.0030s0010.2
MYGQRGSSGQYDRLGPSGPRTRELPGPPILPGPPPPPPARLLPVLPEIDREKTCPLLLRMFPKFNGHHHLEEYQRRGQEPKSEVQVYTWMDATLRELTDLVKEVQPAARRANARLDFALVYPDRKGRNVMRQVGTVFSARDTDDDFKTLRQLNFQTGDFMDVAIF